MTKMDTDGVMQDAGEGERGERGNDQVDYFVFLSSFCNLSYKIILSWD